MRSYRFYCKCSGDDRWRACDGQRVAKRIADAFPGLQKQFGMEIMAHSAMIDGDMERYGLQRDYHLDTIHDRRTDLLITALQVKRHYDDTLLKNPEIMDLTSASLQRLGFMLRSPAPDDNPLHLRGCRFFPCVMNCPLIGAGAVRDSAAKSLTAAVRDSAAELRPQEVRKIY